MRINLSVRLELNGSNSEKAFYSLWGAESIRKHVERLKEMIDVTISVVETTNLKKTHMTCKGSDTTIRGEGTE